MINRGNNWIQITGKQKGRQTGREEEQLGGGKREWERIRVTDGRNVWQCYDAKLKDQKLIKKKEWPTDIWNSWEYNAWNSWE